MIVTAFRKFIYNCLPMGMCASGDIFQYNLDGLLGDINFIKTYINYISVLSKESFSKHIEKTRIIFGRLHTAGLKPNAPKCISGLKEIHYLGYLTTQDGIKPDPKKVKGIMYPGRTTTMTEARALIVMVQYYRYMWPSRSCILDPLTEVAIGPKGKKYLGMMR